jgi:hypothetical protein
LIDVTLSIYSIMHIPTPNYLSIFLSLSKHRQTVCLINNNQF